MNGVKFNRGKTYSSATLNVADPNTIYFTKDTKDIILGGLSYGCSKAIKDRITALESDIPLITTAATNASNSAEAAASKATEATLQLLNLYNIIGSLPDGTAVSVNVGKMMTNKVEIINLRSILAGDQLTDSFDEAIEAGRCHFVYIDDNEDLYSCETSLFKYLSQNYVIAKYQEAAESDSEAITKYKYWEFTKTAAPNLDMFHCTHVYNENTLPSFIRTALVSESIKTKIQVPYNVITVTDSALSFTAESTGSAYGYYTISTANIYTTILDAWGSIASTSSGKIPVLNITLSNPHSNDKFIIPLYRGGTVSLDYVFKGYAASKSYLNTGYLLEVEISSSAARIYVRALGSYSKPAAGIPKTDFTNTVQTSLDLADSSVQVGSAIKGVVTIPDYPYGILGSI